MLENVSFSAYLYDNPLLTLVLIAHFLADFQWQSQEMADKKASDKTFLIRHLLIVAAPLILAFCLIPSACLFLFLVFISHCIIDSGKSYLNAKIADKNWHKSAFVIDQLLHYSFIGAAYSLIPLQTPSWLFDINGGLRLLFFFVLITKPVNIVFKLFFSKYQTGDHDEQQTVAGAGALIGLLERITMAFFLISGQYASIGLVFTAKSIARYDKISKSQAFAEYYLIGSLFSIISVLASYALLYYL
ncbi:DUF3307 domain-containing protein [Streptococcus pantholopis]|uniref:DUF3307 domain-containing protein n=1 Tax=Streptococcus pantholopis TaxID=1811193 RepID=A0A172Q7G2_9STRE|nr:DUF3307 domain-containing protein [Streptococcus pantholopis]AND79362.1 hypothetical protein A0O21_04615 [Streptococcus pantholopis]